jgi:gamma-tubulin complex component 2
MERQNWNLARTQKLLRELITIIKKSSETAAVFHDHLITESGEFTPTLKKASAQNVPKMKLLQEQRALLEVSPDPQELMKKIEQLKDAGVQGIDRYIWLVGQIIGDPDVKKLVSVKLGDKNAEPSSASPSDSTHSAHSPAAEEDSADQSLPDQRSERRASINSKTSAVSDSQDWATWQIQDLTFQDQQVIASKQPESAVRKKVLGVPKPLIEGVSYPGTPQWDLERPYLTGKHLYQQDIIIPTASMISSRRSTFGRELMTNAEANRSLGGYSPAVQELLVLDNLLSMMVGIEGNYLRVRRGRAKENSLTLYVDPSMDSSLQDLAKRILPLCENYLIVSQFAESRRHFKYGLVNHAFAAALRTILQDYYAMVAQLEHQFHLTRLSLQGLWFFCQPMIGVMQALSSVVQKATARDLIGAAILNLLQSQAKAMAGDSSARTLLQKLTQAASVPYFGILEKWVSEGVIDDPYGEFLIDENKALQKDSLSQDYHATYWHQRYSLAQDIPGFLTGYAETILTAGKYINAVRECGCTIKVPFSGDLQGTASGTERPYLERINVAYNHASAELVNLIGNKFDLLGRLRSVKHYFFMDQGDFLVHFMDIAKDELLKRSSSITMEKLQSLLELALRTSVSASDPYHEDLICNMEKTSLLSQLQDTISFGVRNSDRNGIVEQSYMGNLDMSCPLFVNKGASINITGIETFTLDYKVRWPVSLVISRKALTKHQLIFRHLFHFKHVERQLCMTWQAHQATRHLSFKGTAVTRSYVLCQRMVHFLQSTEHYMTFEVLEPNWHVMELKIQSAKSIDEIIQQHDTFLDKCLRECMLLWPRILKKVESLKAVCQQYATTTQWLIPTMNLPFDDPFSEDSSPIRTNTNVNTKSSQRSNTQRIKCWKPEDESNFKATVGKIDEDFRTQLKELIALLSTHSQQEPCFAHLAQALQGEEQAKHSFYR